MKKTNYIIFNVKNYSDTPELLRSGEQVFSSLKTVSNELKINKYYHFRILPTAQYIFFGDLDYYSNGINSFRIMLQRFMKKYYNMDFEKEEFKYTQNNKNNMSYHYSIPKWNLSIEKLKEIMKNFLKEYKSELNVIHDNRQKSCVDTSIYSNKSGKWFRCPNQYKGNHSKGVHIIQYGQMKDFIINYIPKKSINIDNVKLSNKIKNIDLPAKSTNYIMENINRNQNETTINLDLVKKNNYKSDNDMILSTTLSQTFLYKKMFDECYCKDRFEVYNYWISVGMAIKNTFQNEKEALELFNYFSSKGSNYDGYEQTKTKYQTFIQKKNSNGYTIATIHYYAIEDNKPKFIEIISKNSFDLEQTDICKYLKIIAGYKFIYKATNDNYKLYCYNGKYWQIDDTLLKICISNELYDFLKTILIEVYWRSPEFRTIKKKLDKLKTLSYKKDIIQTYKEYGVNNSIHFDDKWWLLGFNNLVYDMELEDFREYKYDDYVSMTCGYDWREPTDDELKTINDILCSIMPDPDDRKLYLQILCTALEGKCLERFIIFNGSGGNGKGLIDDLLLIALGQYGLLSNNGILFEKSKTGCNPEKAQMHKKRLVIFREPSEKDKFENSVIKELTGGGIFSARTLYEKDTEKELNLTMIVECNKRPLFSEEPTDAEIRRLIDLQFKSKFTTDISMVNPDMYIYIANQHYKTRDFQNKHKFALIRILLNEHKKYKENNYCLTIPKTIIEKSQNYLEMSCNIVQWFKDHHYYTDNPNDICKIKEIFEHFANSDYYCNLTKAEKRRYNKTYFRDYLQTNIFFRKYYQDRYKNIRNVIKCWKEKKDDD